jgi:hypothetical protein
VPLLERGTPRPVPFCYTCDVRGDSLRDLYAKTLALLGLGLLGVAGALVDYWPVSGQIPTVEAVLALPAGLTLPAVSPSTSPFEPVADSHRVASPAEVVAEVPALEAPDGMAELVEGPAPALGTPLPPSLAVESAAPGAMPVSVLDLIPPVITASEAMPNTPVPAVVSAQNGDNRFAGAAKTIGRAGARAGGAVASGFGAVASAVGHVFRW